MILFRLVSAPHWSLFPSSLETNKKTHTFFLVWEFAFSHDPKHFLKSLICHLKNLLLPLATWYSNITWLFHMDICHQKSAFLLAFVLLICFVLASTSVFIHFCLLSLYNPLWKEATVPEFPSVSKTIRHKKVKEVHGYVYHMREYKDSLHWNVDKKSHKCETMWILFKARLLIASDNVTSFLQKFS